MKKVAIVIAGLVVLVVVALFVAPSVIDFKPLIASRVKAATGRDLKIDGPLALSLLPSLSVAASGVHLSNAPGAKAPEMVTLQAVDLKAELWPLLGGRFVIDSLTITNPTVNLEVAKDGTPNWAFQAQGAGATSAPASAQGGGGAPANLSLGDIKVTGGSVTYVDDTTGQTLDAKSIGLEAAMAAISTPLTLKAQMTLNNEPVTADVSVDSLGKLEGGQQAKVKLAVNTKQLTANFDGAAQRQPVPGLDGTFDFNVSSVGALFAWLNRPLPKSEPDPGALKIHAVFAASGPKSTLKEASIQGGAIKLTASGSIDASGSVTAVALTLDGGMIDLDRYLPTTNAAPGAAAVAPRAAAAAPAASAPPKPVDIAQYFPYLRKTDADIKVTLAGVKAMGYELGRLALSASDKGGVANLQLAELTLYGGDIKGTVKLDASRDTPALETNLSIEHVTVDKLAQLAGMPATGTASGTLAVSAQGKDTTALFASLSGKLALDLGGVNAKGASLPAISGLKLEADLPGADKPATLKANLTYNREAVEIDATGGPLQKAFGGAKFPAKLALSSSVITITYDGSLELPPAVAADGTFDLDAPSAGKLAAWLGSPLDPKQPDPGLLKVHATLASEGRKITLKDASITGKAIKASAAMDYDGSKPIAALSAKLNIEQANLNAYLPPEEKAGGGGAGPAGKGAPAAGASGWSTTPFAVLALMGEMGGDATIELASVQYRDLDIKQGTLKATAANKVLTLSLDKLSLAQGSASGKLVLDASAAVPKINYQLAASGVQAQPLLKAFADNSRISGTLEFQASGDGSGRSEKELVGTLAGKGQFKVTNGAIHGVNIAKAMRSIGTAGFGGSETEQTDFAELSASYTMKDGVLSNSDLKMQAPLVRLSGKGTVPFPPQTIDYEVEANLVASTQGQGGKDALAGVPIPVKITGSWSDPHYQPDINVLKTIPGALGNLTKGVPGLPIPGTGGGSSQSPAGGNVTKTLKNLFGN